MRNYVDESGQGIRVKIWDTVGEERFKSLTTRQFRRADIVLVCFDLTSASTFGDVKHWIDFARPLAPELANFVLIGNKKDLEHDREVSFSQGK